MPVSSFCLIACLLKTALVVHYTISVSIMFYRKRRMELKSVLTVNERDYNQQSNAACYVIWKTAVTETLCGGPVDEAVLWRVFGTFTLWSRLVQGLAHIQRCRLEGSEILFHPIFSPVHRQWQYQSLETNFTVNFRMEGGQLLVRNEIRSCIRILSALTLFHWDNTSTPL
jgi:hypothetical protein